MDYFQLSIPQIVEGRRSDYPVLRAVNRHQGRVGRVLLGMSEYFRFYHILNKYRTAHHNIVKFYIMRIFLGSDCKGVQQ